MAEPENHTLRILREFREESREFREETQAFQRQSVTFQLNAERGLADLRGDVADLRGDLSEMRHDMTVAKGDVGHIKARVDTLAQAVAGELVQSRYASAAIDERLADIERRLIALERTR